MGKFNDSNQLKSYMKKESKRLGISLQNTYTTYVAREFLERISKFNPGIVLVKGSCVETAYLGSLPRAITDLDLATTTDISHYIHLLSVSFSRGSNNFNYLLSRKPHVTSTGIYKTMMEASLDKTKHPLGIDVQDHYKRLIEKKCIPMPKIFEGDGDFNIFVPSLEEHMAEKLSIVVESNKSDVLNTRVKDFYDIYLLVNSGKYDNEKLTKYLVEMLKLRGKISLDNLSIAYLNDKFIKDHKELWDATKEKYDFVDTVVKFSDAVELTRDVLDKELSKNGLQYKK